MLSLGFGPRQLAAVRRRMKGQYTVQIAFPDKSLW